MDGRVFISYSSKDVVLANKIVAYLEENGYPCWIAPRNITSGHDYTDMINDAIQYCRAVVLIVSDKSVQSQWVKKELSTAVSFNKPILPFRISHVELTGGLQFMLNNVQWIDATINPTGKFSYIVDGLEQRLTEAEAAPKIRRRWPVAVILSLAVAALVGGGLLLWKGQPLEGAPAALVTDTVVPTIVEMPVATDTMVQQSVNTAKEKEKPRKETATTKEKAKETATSTPQVEVVAPVEVPETEPEVATPVAVPVQETPQVTKPDTAGQAQARQAAAKERAFQKKLRLAKNLYIDHNYREALNLFEELRREKPQDKEINAYIKECKRNM